MKRRPFVKTLAILFLRLPGSSEAAKEIRRVSVASTSLASVGYDPGARVLEVEFRSGAVYRYFGVPDTVHRDFMAAESKGRFFTQRIRGAFRFAKIGDPRP